MSSLSFKTTDVEKGEERALTREYFLIAKVVLEYTVYIYNYFIPLLRERIKVRGKWNKSAEQYINRNCYKNIIK